MYSFHTLTNFSFADTTKELLNGAGRGRLLGGEGRPRAGKDGDWAAARTGRGHRQPHRLPDVDGRSVAGERDGGSA